MSIRTALTLYIVILLTVFQYVGSYHINQLNSFKVKRKASLLTPTTSLHATIPAVSIPLQSLNLQKILKVLYTPISKFSQLSLPIKAVAVLFAAFFSKFSAKFSDKLKSAGLESGWTKRGTGGAISRTIEVWVFAITFIVKYVRDSILYYHEVITHSCHANLLFCRNSLRTWRKVIQRFIPQRKRKSHCCCAISC